MSLCLLPKQGNSEILREEYFDHLNQLTLREKILAMTSMLQLTNEEIYERNRIVERIYGFLQPYYPYCNIYVFGSSINGFGLRGCDLDLLFLPFPEYCNLDFKDKGDGSIPRPYCVLNGSYPKEKLMLMEDIHHLKFIKRIFYTKKHFFKNIVFIPAKCPILNIKFMENAISCDFSASNRLVVNNTELLQLFGNIDARVKPLVIILRYWAQSLGFISKSLLSSYAFTLMVIFFLQNVNPPVLPSVKYLIEKAGYSRVIDGWESAICLNHGDIFITENLTSIDVLLVQFFEFYWNFDFIQYVVSPYHGRPLPVKELKESSNERIRNFSVTPFSIQDPFILSLNISRNADMKTPFKLALLIAKRFILDINVTFQSLFSYSFYQEKIDALFENAKNKYMDFVCFPLHLNYNLYCKFCVSDYIDKWYRKVCQVVLDVLQYGLLIECEVVDKVIWGNNFIETPPKKKQKIHADNVGDLQLLMSIQCAAHLDTMFGRKCAQDDDVEDEDESKELPDSLREQFKISKWLFKKRTESYPVLWFMCQCFKYSSIQVPDVIITFSPLSDVSDFDTKKNFLKSYIQKHVKKILYDLDLNNKA